MKIVESLPKLERVSVGDDDAGYYIQSIETQERLDIRFNTPREAVRYAHSEYLVIVSEDIQPINVSY